MHLNQSQPGHNLNGNINVLNNYKGISFYVVFWPIRFQTFVETNVDGVSRHKYTSTAEGKG